MEYYGNINYIIVLKSCLVLEEMDFFSIMEFKLSDLHSIPFLDAIASVELHRLFGKQSCHPVFHIFQMIFECF